MEKWISRKLVVALVGVATVVATQLGVPEEQAGHIGELVTAIVMTYLGGQSVVDAVGARKAQG